MEREATEEIIDFREMSTDLVVESDPEVVESDVEMGTIVPRDEAEVIALDDVDGSGVEEEKSVSEDATLSSLDINAEQTEAQKIQIHRLWLTGGFKSGTCYRRRR